MIAPAPLFLLVFLGATPPPGLPSPASAELCGRCHRAIHEAWKSSSHAQAVESRLFQDALEVAESEFGAAARATCLGCHSPVGARTGDLALTRKVSWEGVTCDYCHSIRDVTMAVPNPKVDVAFGPIKSGPWKDSVSSGHSVAYSPIHISSLVCAPCHEYRNSSGFAVLTTYSEWKNSSYGKDGRSCQTCHMARVAGNVVDPHVERSRVAQINLHSMPGSHSLQQLTRALKARLSTRREGGQLLVNVDVANDKAGHYFPTGSPLRRLVLEVQADAYNGRNFRGERIYARNVADAQNVPASREHVAFLKATQVLSDTRLAPGERRVETFVFPIAEGVRTRVTATFTYHYSPVARTEAEQRVRFLSLSQLVQ